MGYLAHVVKRRPVRSVDEAKRVRSNMGPNGNQSGSFTVRRRNHHPQQPVPNACSSSVNSSAMSSNRRRRETVHVGTPVPQHSTPVAVQLLWVLSHRSVRMESRVVEREAEVRHSSGELEQHSDSTGKARPLSGTAAR